MAELVMQGNVMMVAPCQCTDRLLVLCSLQGKVFAVNNAEYPCNMQGVETDSSQFVIDVLIVCHTVNHIDNPQLFNEKALS